MSDLPDLALEGGEVPREDTIRVICRFRPLNDAEERAGSKFVVKFVFLKRNDKLDSIFSKRNHRAFCIQNFAGLCFTQTPTSPLHGPRSVIFARVSSKTIFHPEKFFFVMAKFYPKTIKN